MPSATSTSVQSVVVDVVGPARPGFCGSIKEALKQHLRALRRRHPLKFRLVKIVIGLSVAGLQFFDIYADFSVGLQLHGCGDVIWGSLTFVFIGQAMLVAYGLTIRYVRNVYGAGDRCCALKVLWAGPLLGVAALDLLMLLEPLTMLWVLDRLGWHQLRLLLPSYRAVRSLTETILESLFQTCLQTYILRRVRFGDQKVPRCL